MQCTEDHLMMAYVTANFLSPVHRSKFAPVQVKHIHATLVLLWDLTTLMKGCIFLLFKDKTSLLLHYYRLDLLWRLSHCSTTFWSPACLTMCWQQLSMVCACLQDRGPFSIDWNWRFICDLICTWAAALLSCNPCQSAIGLIWKCWCVGGFSVWIISNMWIEFPLDTPLWNTFGLAWLYDGVRITCDVSVAWEITCRGNIAHGDGDILMAM